MPADPLYPPVPGITFRGYQDQRDVPHLLAVHAACRERDTLDPYSVCYRLPFLPPERYAEQITLPKATLIAEADGNVVAHGFMEAWGAQDRAYLWQVWVRPDFRNRGLGTLIHRWGKNCARQLHGADSRPALHLANATAGEADAARLLRNEGYHLSFVSPELAFDLADDLPQPAPPPGIVLRPLGHSAARAVARALSEANLDLSGPELAARLAADADEWDGRVQDSDIDLSVVAWDGDQVAGAYLCRRRDTVGDIAQVAVRRPWRNRGIARALAMQSLHNLKAGGCVTARLFTSAPPDDVEPTDGPYAMYRKFGFYPIARHLRFRKPMLPADE